MSPAEPSLARRGAGLVLAYTAGAQERRSLRVMRSGPDGRLGAPQDHAPASGAAAQLPRVVVSGGTLVVAWSRAGRPAVSIGPKRIDLPARGQVQALELAASGGSAFVTTAERVALRTGGATTQRVYSRDVGPAGVRTVSELPPGSKAPDAVVQLLGATAARGVSTVSTTGGISTSR